jgi:rRNA-processing protein FCF1
MPRLFPQNAILTDTCVIIDLVTANETVTNLISKHIGQLYTLPQVVEEVKTIDPNLKLTELGFIIIDAHVGGLYDASLPLMGLSLCDKLLFFTAQLDNIYLATNDKGIRSQCKKNNVTVFWGLELILKLHKSGGISSGDAKQIALKIMESNDYITYEIYIDFCNKIDNN